MAESLDHAAAVSTFRADAGAGRDLVSVTLASPSDTARTLADLQRAGFTALEIAVVARVDGLSSPTALADWLAGDGDAVIIACRGLGTLSVGGGAVPALRALGSRASFAELGRAFSDAGLPDADALIYELGLIRGQCLLAVRVATAERGQIAYRLLLRGGSREVQVYRS
jgi:hypothetical protein